MSYYRDLSLIALDELNDTIHTGFNSVEIIGDSDYHVMYDVITQSSKIL